MNYLKQLKIPNKQGEFINLEEIATFHVGPGIYAFYHDRGEGTITVTRELDDKVITSLERYWCQIRIMPLNPACLLGSRPR
jgi:hypothetical protein